jgi:DNA-binding transcriptional ArsR family regulator
MVTIAKDKPLNEITLRRYEKPYELQGRELIKKLCLSIGLLQPGDSRDIIVDIFRVLLDAKKKKQELDSKIIEEEVIKLRKKEKLALKGIASSNIRRQLKRLRDLYLVDKVNNSYMISEFENLNILFEKKIEQFYLANILERVKEYFDTLDNNR